MRTSGPESQRSQLGGVISQGILAAGGFDAVIGAPPPYRPFAVPAREEYFQTHYDAYAVSMACMAISWNGPCRS